MTSRTTCFVLCLALTGTGCKSTPPAPVESPETAFNRFVDDVEALTLALVRGQPYDTARWGALTMRTPGSFGVAPQADLPRLAGAIPRVRWTDFRAFYGETGNEVEVGLVVLPGHQVRYHAVRHHAERNTGRGDPIQMATFTGFGRFGDQVLARMAGACDLRAPTTAEFAQNDPRSAFQFVPTDLDNTYRTLACEGVRRMSPVQRMSAGFGPITISLGSDGEPGLWCNLFRQPENNQFRLSSWSCSARNP
jgi:hypothetical protein